MTVSDIARDNSLDINCAEIVSKIDRLILSKSIQTMYTNTLTNSITLPNTIALTIRYANRDIMYQVKTSLHFCVLLNSFIQRENYIPQQCTIGNVEIEFRDKDILRSTLGQIGVNNKHRVIAIS